MRGGGVLITVTHSIRIFKRSHVLGFCYKSACVEIPTEGGFELLTGKHYTVFPMI
jgi:hypothetical protein